MIFRTFPAVFIIIIASFTLCFAGATDYVGGLGRMAGQPVAVYFLAAGIAFFSFLIVLISPTSGIILAMVIYPFVLQDARMTVAKVFASIVLFGFFVAWLAGKIVLSRGRKTEKDYLGCERALLLFAVYMAINAVYAVISGVSPLDIVRDLIPMSGLVIFLIAKRFVRKPESFALLEKVQFCLMAVLTLKFALSAFGPGYNVLNYVPAGGGELQLLGLFSASMVGLICFKSSKRLLIATAIITSIYLISTETRTFFIAGLLILCMALLLTRVTRAKVLFLFICLVLFSSAYLVVQEYAAGALEKKTAKLQEIADAQSDLSIMDRIGEAKQCFVLFKKNPVLGTGIGYVYHLFRRSLQGYFVNDYWITNFTHADLLFLLSKIGLAGTILFLWFYYRMLKLAWRIWKRAKNRDMRARGLICFIILVIALVIGQSTPVLQTRPDAFFLALIMGYTYCLYRFHVAMPAEERAVERVPVERVPVARVSVARVPHDSPIF